MNFCGLNAIVKRYKQILDRYFQNSPIILENINGRGYYHPNTRTIYSPRRAFVFYHELGHDVWEYHEKPDLELFQTAYNLGLYKEDDIDAFLTSLCEEKRTGRTGLVAISDLMLGIINVYSDLWSCHERDYYKNNPSLFSNEFFANICGLIGTNKVNSLMVTYTLFPDAVNKVFEVLNNLKEKDKT